MSQNTRISDRFEYHLEDLDCADCLYYKRMNKFTGHGCGGKTCRFEDIRMEAIAKGRIKRPRGWFRRRE